MGSDTDPMATMRRAMEQAQLANVSEAERQRRIAQLIMFRQTGVLPPDEVNMWSRPQPLTFGAYVHAYEQAQWSVFVMYWPAIAFAALIGRE